MMQKHFYTPRKGAEGLGSARSGTRAHWAMTVTGAALAVLTPIFVFTVLCGMAGVDRTMLVGPQVIAYFGRPFVAIITGLFLFVGLLHWMRGTQIVIDDYLHGACRNWAIIAVKIAGWLLIAIAAFALVRLTMMQILVSM